MRNLSPLFTRPEDGFLPSVTLTPEQRTKITEAKNKIKETLRTGITVAIKEQRGVDLSPRFMSQGSAVYKTRNQPCSTPPQQIDHDLGCYLPLSFHKETGRPDIASDVFFTVVDKVLEHLVRVNNWAALDTTKDTCSRVVIDEEVHIDVPLYSIPDSEFHTITEAFNASDAALRKSVKDSRDWGDVESKNVLLAHRTQDWKSSDPRKLNKYFTRIFEIKGEQLRRISRYLKAWRDFVWKQGGPSSIFLMLLADSAFEAEIDRRDDLALLDVLKGISIHGRRSIKNPVDESETISVSEADFVLLRREVGQFANDLEQAIMTPVSSSEACQLVQAHLGDRFPSEPNIPFDPTDVRKLVVESPIVAMPDRQPNDRGRAG